MFGKCEGPDSSLFLRPGWFITNLISLLGWFEPIEFLLILYPNLGMELAYCSVNLELDSESM